MVIVILSLPSGDNKNNDVCWFITTNRRLACLAYLVNASAWVVSERLMRYEYRKRLSEAFYSHKLFWTLNLLTDIIGLAVDYDEMVLSEFFIHLIKM